MPSLPLKHATNLARSLNSRLVLVHAYPDLADVEGYSDYDLLAAKRKEKGKEVLEAMRSAVEEPTLVEDAVLLQGPEAQAILKAAEDHKAQLIVMGTRGLGSFKGWLVGSVSQKVAHLAECPVLLVR